MPSSDESSFSYDPATEQFVATVKQGTEWGRSVWLSTAPAKQFGAFTKPELIFHADEQDQINRRERVKKILEGPEYLSPPIVDDVDYIAEVYNMHVLRACYVLSCILLVASPTVLSLTCSVPLAGLQRTRVSTLASLRETHLVCLMLAPPRLSYMP